MGSAALHKPLPHAVLVPYPTQGHMNPFMQLAMLLHSRGFNITFVNTEHNHRRLIRSKGLHFVQGFVVFQIEAIPNGLPRSDLDATQDVRTLTHNILHDVLKPPFIQLLQRLNSKNDSPPVTCVIADGLMSFAREVADEHGIRLSVQFWTASACGFMAYLQFDELVRRGIFPFKDGSFVTDGTLEMIIDWIAGMPEMRLRDMPSFIRITDLDNARFNQHSILVRKTLKSSAIFFNTFYDFEQEVLEAIKKLHPNIYTAGPLSMLVSRHTPKSKPESVNSSLWKEDKQCVERLDKRAPETVVYVNYGSITTMSDQHLMEFAWGLANSKHPFLWVVRPDVVMGESESKSAILPKEFYDEVENRGLLVSWCPQAEVLKHPSIGAYLSHCGWNSMLESVEGGVPLLCWPYFAEQQTNCRYACTAWGMGMELDHEVKREELEELGREMEGDKGRELRRNAKEWRRKVEAAPDVGGSSVEDFDRFVNERLSSLLSRVNFGLNVFTTSLSINRIS